jgi:dTMP kinase
MIETKNLFCTRKRGLFITFEGIDGSGKTTQAKLLKNYLTSKGLKVKLINDNNESRVSKMIMKIITNPNLREIYAETELLLFTAIRAQNVRELILPALSDGVTVILNRYSDAMIAYQGYGRNLPIEIIKSLNEFATGGLKPDLTILLDLNPLEAVQRIKKFREVNRIESEEIEFYQRVREGYLKIAEAEPERVKVINATKPIDQIHSEIIQLLGHFII